MESHNLFFDFFTYPYCPKEQKREKVLEVIFAFCGTVGDSSGVIPFFLPYLQSSGGQFNSDSENNSENPSEFLDMSKLKIFDFFI